MIRTLFEKYRHWILYGVFGVGTTVVNIAVYLGCYQMLGIANVPSNLVAWVAAVTFAFFTNKVWVFDSRVFTSRLVVAEAVRFYGGRVATGVLDLTIMYIGVDVLAGPAAAWKIADDIVVIVINYLVSRYWVFRRQRKK